MVLVLYAKNPLFYSPFLLLFPDAGAVIHSHSKAAVLATLLCPGREFRITHIEMIKGVMNYETGELNEQEPSSGENSNLWLDVPFHTHHILYTNEQLGWFGV